MAWVVWLCTADVSLQAVSQAAELSVASEGWVAHAQFSPGDAAPIVPGQRASWRGVRGARAIETSVLSVKSLQDETAVTLAAGKESVDSGSGQLEVELQRGSPAVILWETLRRGDWM